MHFTDKRSISQALRKDGLPNSGNDVMTLCKIALSFGIAKVMRVAGTSDSTACSFYKTVSDLDGNGSENGTLSISSFPHRTRHRCEKSQSLADVERNISVPS